MWSEEDQKQKIIAKSKGQAQVKCQLTGYENTTQLEQNQKKKKDNEIIYILKRSIIQKTHEDHIRVAINRRKAY